MVQRGEDLRLTLEAREALGIAGERFGQDLQGDIAVQFGVPGSVNDTHAAGAHLLAHPEEDLDRQLIEFFIR